MRFPPAASWACLASLLIICSVASTHAVEPETGFTPSDDFQAWVTDLVREQLPADYEKSKNWGNTKRVVVGLDFEPDGLKIETRRRYKQVNDGTWTRYKVTPIEPEKHFAVRVEHIEQLSGNKVRVQLSAVSKVKLYARMSQWERGVQLVSLSAEADAKVRVQGTVEIALKLDPTKLPPDVFLVPTVTTADAQIAEFELQRVGKFEGPLIKSLSDDARDVLAAEIAERRPKLVESMNKQLAKKQDKLKFSLSDLLKSEWGKYAPPELTGGAADRKEPPKSGSPTR